MFEQQIVWRKMNVYRKSCAIVCSNQIVDNYYKPKILAVDQCVATVCTMNMMTIELVNVIVCLNFHDRWPLEFIHLVMPLPSTIKTFTPNYLLIKRFFFVLLSFWLLYLHWTQWLFRSQQQRFIFTQLTFAFQFHAHYKFHDSFTPYQNRFQFDLSALFDNWWNEI